MSATEAPLISHRERLWQTVEGRPVWRITFAGNYPVGSSGNPIADKMGRFVQETTADRVSAAILFDLTELHYEWGDAILSGLLVRPEKHRRSTSPTSRTVYCFLATGQTRKALESLFTAVRWIGDDLAQIFDSDTEALAYVHTAAPPESGS